MQLYLPSSEHYFPNNSNATSFTTDVNIYQNTQMLTEECEVSEIHNTDVYHKNQREKRDFLNQQQ